MTTKPAQFTPGPWIVEENGVLPDRPYTVGKLLYNVADVGNIYDANLIAAAPAMYEALQWAKQYLRMPDFHPDNSYNSEEWARDYNKLNDALAQAEGGRP